jgi:hypothetical protein
MQNTGFGLLATYAARFYTGLTGRGGINATEDEDFASGATARAKKTPRSPHQRLAMEEALHTHWG